MLGSKDFKTKGQIQCRRSISFRTRADKIWRSIGFRTRADKFLTSIDFELSMTKDRS